jgi:hypothetical protein
MKIDYEIVALPSQELIEQAFTDVLAAVHAGSLTIHQRQHAAEASVLFDVVLGLTSCQYRPKISLTQKQWRI